MAGKVVVDKELLEKLLNYVVEDEQKDWESYGETEEERPKEHIYLTIRALSETKPQYAVIINALPSYAGIHKIEYIGSMEEVKKYLAEQMDLECLEVILPLDGSWDVVDFPKHYEEFGLQWDKVWIRLNEKGVHNG